MKGRRLRLMAIASRQISEAEDWWFKNRDHQAVFAKALAAAFNRLQATPSIGMRYLRGHRPLRRIYIPKLSAHIYYSYDAKGVVIWAYWGARRGRMPTLVN